MTAPQGLPRWLERLVLLAYPASFRRRFGGELLRFLRLQRREAVYRTRVAGPMRFVVDVLLDAARNGLRARIEALRTEGRGMRGFASELRTALRSLARAPGFSLTVALTLGLGIGAATAVYSIADWIVLRPVPGVEGHDRIVTVRFQRENSAGAWFLVSHPDLEDLARRTPALAHAAGSHFADGHARLPGTDASLRLPLELVSADYFEVLGVRPVLGRVPQALAGEDPRTVVVSHRLWRAELGGDPGVVGRTLTLNGQPFSVVGVAPPRFHGPAPAERMTDLWVPVEAHASTLPAYPADLLAMRDGWLYFTMYGRLVGEEERELVAAQLASARAAIVAEHGSASSLDGFVTVVESGVGVAPWIRGRAETTMGILLAAVALLVLLGCANAGNLLVTRSLGRAQELSVRRALGAGRTRIVLQLVAEGLFLGLLGGLAGVGMARGLLFFHGRERFLAWLPTFDTIPMDRRVILFAAGISVATGVLFSLAPALTASRRADARLGGGSRVTDGARTLRGLLVGIQVALSLALVVGAGLLMDTVRTLGRVDLGFEPEHVLEATLDPGTQGYGAEERVAFWRELVARSRRLPGVGAAGLAYAPLHGQIGSSARVWTGDMDEDDAIAARQNQVSDGFLAALGVPLVAGRDFLPDEVLASAPRDVVILSEGLAGSLFGGSPEAAVGRHVSLARRRGRSFEVVGVGGDVKVAGVKEETALVLEPMGQVSVSQWGTLYLRSDASTSPVGPFRQVVRELDPALPIYDVQRLGDRVASSYSEERLLAGLTSLFGGLALLLAGLGLYGVMSHAVAARTRELGLRVALGARGRAVRHMVLGQGLRLVTLGLVPGLALAALAARVAESRLWGVAPFELRIYVLAVATVVAMGVLASWLPAVRATRIDPAEALRGD